jgi:hypothetical protein
MVGRLTLDQVVKVRVLAPQPQKSPGNRGFSFAKEAITMGEGQQTGQHHRNPLNYDQARKHVVSVAEDVGGDWRIDVRGNIAEGVRGYFASDRPLSDVIPPDEPGLLHGAERIVAAIESGTVDVPDRRKDFIAAAIEILKASPSA